MSEHVPSLGRIVHVRIRPGVWRPAIVTQVFGDVVNVQVFLDGPNDQVPDLGGTKWMGSVVPEADDQPSTPVWRWPPRS